MNFTTWGHSKCFLKILEDSGRFWKDGRSFKAVGGRLGAARGRAGGWGLSWKWHWRFIASPTPSFGGFFRDSFLLGFWDARDDLATFSCPSFMGFSSFQINLELNYRMRGWVWFHCRFRPSVGILRWTHRQLSCKLSNRNKAGSHWDFPTPRHRQSMRITVDWPIMERGDGGVARGARQLFSIGGRPKLPMAISWSATEKRTWPLLRETLHFTGLQFLNVNWWLVTWWIGDSTILRRTLFDKHQHSGTLFNDGWRRKRRLISYSTCVIGDGSWAWVSATAIAPIATSLLLKETQMIIYLLFNIFFLLLLLPVCVCVCVCV